MNLPYNTIQDLVAALRSKHFPGFYVLPYNRFDVEHSQHWWLSPTSEKAAFRYGKAVFTTDESWVDEGNVFCGFNVEKGVLHEGGWNKNTVMNESWFWNRFLDLANVPLASAVEQARVAVDDNLQIYVSAGMLVPGQAWAQLLLDVKKDRLTQAMYRPVDGVLVDVARSNTFSELADSLRTLDGTPTAWQWIDLLVGQSFTLDPNGPDHTDNCAALLKPFEIWMRTAV